MRRYVTTQRTFKSIKIGYVISFLFKLFAGVMILVMITGAVTSSAAGEPIGGVILVTLFFAGILFGIGAVIRVICRAAKWWYHD